MYYSANIGDNCIKNMYMHVYTVYITVCEQPTLCRLNVLMCACAAHVCLHVYVCFQLSAGLLGATGGS